MLKCLLADKMFTELNMSFCLLVHLMPWTICWLVTVVWMGDQVNEWRWLWFKHITWS